MHHLQRVRACTLHPHPGVFKLLKKILQYGCTVTQELRNIWLFIFIFGYELVRTVLASTSTRKNRNERKPRSAVEATLLVDFPLPLVHGITELVCRPQLLLQLALLSACLKIERCP